MNSKDKDLITGASGGIGSAITKKYFELGYNLILTSSLESKLENLKKLYGEEHSYYKLDLSNLDKLPEDIDNILNIHNNIKILINNAGLTADNLMLRMKLTEWNEVLNTNLSSNFVIIKSILPQMIKNKFGKIIGISSVVGVSGNPGQANYVASKSGMIGLYKSLAQEVASRNINVNLVSPGFIKSPMTEKLNDIQKKNILDNIPMKKFGNPDDVANLVYFLSSEDASYITGQNFHINGGMLMV